MKEKVIITVGALTGGVLSSLAQISHALLERSYAVDVVVIQQRRTEFGSTERSCLDERVQLYFTKDISIQYDQRKAKRIAYFANTVIRIQEKLQLKPNNKMLVKKEYGRRLFGKVEAIKEILRRNEENTIIAMGTHAIWCTLLATENSNKNRVILYELSDPSVQSSSRTFMGFVKYLYPKSNAMVFETQDAMTWYCKHISVNGCVINNFLRNDIPPTYCGVRKKAIVNFCRISREKNLGMLIEAFGHFYQNQRHNEYELYIYGDVNQCGDSDGYYEELKNQIHILGLDKVVHMLPARKDILNVISDYSMYISTSDYEGLSNSTIEALAIGLPTICTDLGPNREVISSYENGILIPTGDTLALYNSMIRIATDEELSKKLSANGQKIREKLATPLLVDKWISVIEGDSYEIG